jgi:CBS domain-containing protein
VKERATHLFPEPEALSQVTDLAAGWFGRHFARVGAIAAAAASGGLLAGVVHRAARAKAGGVTAADLMTSPAVTIGPDDTVEHAAKLLYDRKVKRLPVVDQGGRLVGIISRTDILAVFDRPDAEIREEIMTQVIAGRSEPSWYSVIVKDGVVTLEGAPETAAIGHALVSRTRHVQGVVAVRDRLVYPVPPVPSRPGPYF